MFQTFVIYLAMKTLLVFNIVLLLCTIILATGDNNKLAIESTACDLKARNESCAAGFCCVRDEFLYTETLCRPLGKAGDACSTKSTEFECPCEAGFQCASNIHGHVTSLFGKCYPIPGQTTDGTLNFLTSENPGSDITTNGDSGFHMETTPAGFMYETTEDTIKQGQTKPFQHDGNAIIG